MVVLTIIAAYLLGVWLAFFQVKKWQGKGRVYNEEEVVALFMLSTLSWFIYPLYAICWLTEKCKEIANEY